MAYHVVKTIKGKQYLYSQSTYREEGKVKTISHYIGVVDSHTGVLITPTDKPIVSRPTDAAQQVSHVLTPDKPNETPQNSPKPEEPALTRQKPTFKLNDTVKISRKALENEYTRAANKLKKYGVNPATFPPVTVKHSGAGYTHYKAAFKTTIMVTVPKKAGREKLRKEYRKALHQSFIDTLQREAPEKIAPFKYAFDDAYRVTQNALTQYLWNCNSRGSFARILALKVFSIMHPIPTGKYSKLPAEKLGLVDYGKRKDWKTDYCDLMAEIDKKGINALYAQAKREIAIANHTQRKAIKKRTLFFIRRRKKVKRLQARIDANRALLRKLHLIREFQIVT